ncbi:YihY/virulence factor BrkB family protein [Microbacterium sp. dk485]|uniref:YihY/virulence factor BrkB family protein n=1 Tax=Microbacterium sp. dk485 TaxID=2560021 RepID=UPI001ADDA8CB|nr:YihY/virulence factor BrkB family protein [Microbacterium sp. dk485]
MSSTVVSRLTAWALARRPVRAFLLYSRHRGPMLADSVTYRTLFALFAGVLLGFSVAALWLAGNREAWNALVGALDAAVPGLVGVIDLDAVRAPTGLTVAGIVSAIGLVGAAIGAVGSLRSALRSIAGVAVDDVLFIWVILRNLLLAIGIGLGLAAAAAATFLATAGLSVLTGWLGIPEGEPALGFVAWLVSALVVFVLDTLVVGVSFRLLSGIRARPRTLWLGAMLGGFGLTVLQQLSGLFVGGAAANPLLTTFASFIALLLWLNLSSQVILIAAAYIVMGVEEDEDRVSARFGAATFAQFRVRRAEKEVQAVSAELAAAREAEEEERANA